jgi:hypothetical protein
MEERKPAAVKRQLWKTNTDGTIRTPLTRNAVNRQGFKCVKLVQDRLQWRPMLSMVLKLWVLPTEYRGRQFQYTPHATSTPPHRYADTPNKACSSSAGPNRPPPPHIYIQGARQVLELKTNNWCCQRAWEEQNFRVRVHKFSKKLRRDLEILGARGGEMSKSYTGDPQMLGTTKQNPVSRNLEDVYEPEADASAHSGQSDDPVTT